MDSTELIYEGPDALVPLVLHEFEARGVGASYPGEALETRSEVVNLVVVPILVMASYDLLKRALVEVCEAFPELKLWIKGEEPPGK